MIKVLTDQSASDSEPAIILTESNEHSEPLLSPKHERRCQPLAVGKPQGEKGEREGEREGKSRMRKKERGEGQREGQQNWQAGKRQPGILFPLNYFPFPLH